MFASFRFTQLIRMPTRDELQGIVDYGRRSPPAIDTRYFPNTRGKAINRRRTFALGEP